MRLTTYCLILSALGVAGVTCKAWLRGKRDKTSDVSEELSSKR